MAQQPEAQSHAELPADLRAAILSATQAADFDRERMELDVYRALRGAGVTLSPAETVAMATAAVLRGYPGEAEAIAAELFVDGISKSAEAADFTGMMERIRHGAAQDREGGLARSVETAGNRYSADFWIVTGQAFAGAGDHERAVEYYTRGLILNDPSEAELAVLAAAASQEYRRAAEFYRLSLGPDRRQLTPQGLALAHLNLGISLFKLGRVHEAHVMWTSIEGSDTVEILAEVWLGVADRASE